VTTVQARLDEALAACAVLKEALESVHVDHWCAACPGGDEPCRALSLTAGSDELERRAKAEKQLAELERLTSVDKLWDAAFLGHNLKLAEAVVEAARDEIAEDQSECADLIAAVAVYDAGRRK
jgi:hypothetical protein